MAMHICEVGTDTKIYVRLVYYSLQLCISLISKNRRKFGCFSSREISPIYCGMETFQNGIYDFVGFPETSRKVFIRCSLNNKTNVHLITLSVEIRGDRL